jgi:23S rRNA (guanosine2251-2'-O)-methyltransferase
MLIYGINPVIEALRTGRVRAIRVSGRGGDRTREIVQEAGRRGVPVRRVEPAALDRETRGGVHQGVVAELGEVEACTPTGLVAGLDHPALLVVLDGVEDPHNLGAIARTVDAAGADGLIVQTRRAAALDGAAAKASAGALAHVRVARVVNIARAVDELKAAGVWTVGLAADGPQAYDAIDYREPTALVLGAEGVGLRRLVREQCDWVAAIPMGGQVGSLNVSVACGVVLFEAARQRRGAAGRPKD